MTLEPEVVWMARGIPAAVLDHFRGVPLFGALSKAGLRSVARAATEVDVPTGRTIVREGETDRFLYVIVSGSAAVTRKGRRIRGLHVGDFFGDLALLDGGPRSATVTAVTDMTLMVLSPREMEPVIRAEPGVALAMLKAMAGRLRTASSSPIG
jgi:CRP/FNR family transcriptional regulator, cyclic AMP receptor protein